MSSTGARSSESFPWEFAAPCASGGRPFAVGDRRERRSRRASAQRERDLARVRDPSLEESAVAYLAAGVQTTAGGSTQGWIWWQDFMRSLGESPEQHGELADGPEVRLRIEGFYLRFVVWLVHVRRVQVETARKYFGEALSAHTSFYPLLRSTGPWIQHAAGAQDAQGHGQGDRRAPSTASAGGAYAGLEGRSRRASRRLRVGC